MTLKKEVVDALQALCEGRGVDVCDCGDIHVRLASEPMHVHVHDGDSGVSVYREVAASVERSGRIALRLNEHNRRAGVFRLVWENDSVFLRADLAAPFSARQLQRVLDDFDEMARSAAQEVGE